MLGLSLSLRPSVSRRVLALTTLVASLYGAGCTCGAGPYEGEYFDGDRPAPLENFDFVESEKGEPKVVGCADGQREGFASLKDHPRVAGCVGVWEGQKSLRDKPTGKACGDDLKNSKCAVPADLCAEGWHVCGQQGKASDLSDRASAAACDNAGPGRFNAAMSHSPNDEIDPCPNITKNTVLPCMLNGLGSEPVCCGNDCRYGKCRDGVWKDKTKISVGTVEGCGSLSSERNGGILCCYDGDGDPAASAANAAAAGGESGEEAAAAEGETEGAAEAPETGGKAEEAAAAGEEKPASEEAGEEKAGGETPGSAKAAEAAEKPAAAKPAAEKPAAAKPAAEKPAEAPKRKAPTPPAPAE